MITLFADTRLRVRHLAVAVLGLAAAAATAVPASALNTPGDEKKKLRACEKKLCNIILKKQATGEDLRCSIGRTWQKSKIVKGVRQKRITWTFGDARCTVDVKMSRAEIIAALSKSKHDVVLDRHTINCQVERSEGITDVKIDMAPKLAFKNGRAEKAWLNVSKIDAPTIIKGALWTVTKLEDNVGLFHAEMIEEINEFVHEKCAKRYGG